jgi:flagellar FliL protein
MADKDKERREDKNEGDEDKKPSGGDSKLKNILFLGLGAVLLVAVSVGTTLLVSGKGSSGEDEAVADEQAAETDIADKAGDKKGKKSKKGKKGKKGKDGKEEATASNYLALDPPFVVNFETTTEARFLQVSVEVMASDTAALEDVKKHMPAIRNSLVLLLSSQNYKTLSTLEGKEQIRSNALTVIQKILQERTGKPGVEAVYFTGFVMQ